MKTTENLFSYPYIYRKAEKLGIIFTCDMFILDNLPRNFNSDVSFI